MAHKLASVAGEVVDVSIRASQEAIGASVEASMEAISRAKEISSLAKETAEVLITESRKTAETSIRAAEEAIEASKRAAKGAAEISIRAFEEMISQAEETDKQINETAEVSIRAFEAAINQPKGDLYDKTDKISSGNLDEMVSKTGKTVETSVREEKIEGQVNGESEPVNAESRLDVLTRVYEAR